ncbi:MAG: cell wall hydrolase [Lachnospiraceae bacterium]|nr:cell wall hydrolase [Lachnospiraceae bacterium]
MYQYKRFGTGLLIMQVLLACLFAVKGVTVNRIAATPAFQLRFAEDFVPVEKTSLGGMIIQAASGQRVVDFQVMEQSEVLSKEDYEALLRIVEAEAGGEDLKGRILVANVVLNRVENEMFPDTVNDVIFQKENGRCQFSPIHDGRYYTVKVSEETTEAVNRALAGEDYSEGALYFAARSHADPLRMQWFDTHLTRLFAYGGHEFFS